MESEPPASGASGMLRKMKLDFLTWFICALTCYRLTVLVSRDIGPFGVFHNLRKHSKLLKCPYCMSVYTGAFVSLGLFIDGISMTIPMWFILSLSFSAVSIVLDRCFSADYQPK